MYENPNCPRLGGSRALLRLRNLRKVAQGRMLAAKLSGLESAARLLYKRTLCGVPVRVGDFGASAGSLPTACGARRSPHTLETTQRRDMRFCRQRPLSVAPSFGSLLRATLAPRGAAQTSQVTNGSLPAVSVSLCILLGDRSKLGERRGKLDEHPPSLFVKDCVEGCDICLGICRLSNGQMSNDCRPTVEFASKQCRMSFGRAS